MVYENSMTLEDFFTLIEMKDGLTDLARVKELVSVIQKEKDCTVKNVEEAARQWSAVASTLVATENKDCLDLFIQLDGLCLFDCWLQEVQKSDGISDSFAEESIISLLAALVKLPIDNERSISSGISATVENLFGHKSLRVQDRARALFDGWNQVRDNDAGHQDIVKGGACQDDEVPARAKGSVESGHSEHSAVNNSPLIGSADEDIHFAEPSGGEFQHSRSSDGSDSQCVEDVKLPISNNQHISLTTLDQAEDDAFRGDVLGSSIMPDPCQRSQSIMEESSLHSAERTVSTGTCSSPVLMKGDVEGKSLNVPELKDFIDDSKETNVVKARQGKSAGEAISSVSASLGPQCVFSTTNRDDKQSVMEPAVSIDVDAREKEYSLNRIPLDPDIDTNTLLSKPKNGVVEYGVQKHFRSTEEPKSTGQGGECYSNALQELPSNGCTLRKTEGLETYFCSAEDGREDNNVKDLTESRLKVGRREELAIPVNISKLIIDTEESDRIDGRRSDVELGYGVDDALEVARQVAKEVEREVVDYREPLCSSSSEKYSEGGVVEPDSPVSINGGQDQQMTGPLNEAPTGQNLSVAATSPMRIEFLINLKTIDTKPEDCMQEPVSSQLTEAAQEPEGNTERGICGFDLNEEVCLEEMDHPKSFISAPIAVVAASKAAAAPGLPVTPLHFAGALGWKGSAATSAFRPASSRRTPDGEKTISVEGSSHSSKQRQDILDIDLNVAGVDDDGITDPVTAKQFPVSSGIPSGESSIEVSSRRAERLKLDLNRVSDNEDVPLSNWRMDGRFLYHHQNGHRSPSPTSSLSSRQPSRRNFDLNDSPSCFDDSSDQQLDLGKSSSQDMTAYRGFKMDGPDVSILGKRVEVNRKEFVTQIRSFLPNGQVSESTREANLAISVGGVGSSPAMAHKPSSPLAFGYNGLTVGPSMSVTPAMYGPSNIPYMIDLRGAPMLPPMMGGSPAADPPSYSRPLFGMSMSGLPSGLNGVAASQPGLDLNSGMMMLERDSRESGGLRQLFVQGQVGSTDEQMRSASQCLKRKEPDGGLDSYLVSYKWQSPGN